jgi:hypothetical protein
MVAMLSVTRVAKVLEVVSTNTQNSIVRRVIDHGPYLLLLLDSVSLSGLYPRVRPAPDAPLAGRLLPLWRPFDAVRSDFSSAVAAVVLDSYCEPPVDSDHTGVGGGASRGL